MANLGTSCEVLSRKAARVAFCRASSATALHASLPDSLTSQAITAPPLYTSVGVIDRAQPRILQDQDCRIVPR